MSMILLQSAYKILITRMRFKRRTISVTPFSMNLPILDWQPVKSGARYSCLSTFVPLPMKW
jgi:hypothetical protein